MIPGFRSPLGGMSPGMALLATALLAGANPIVRPVADAPDVPGGGDPPAEAPPNAGGPEDEGQAPSTGLALRVCDVRSYPAEVLDQVILDGRTVTLHGPSRRDPLGNESHVPEVGRPVAVIVPIAEYRRLLRQGQALRKLGSVLQDVGQRCRNVADAV